MLHKVTYYLYIKLLKELCLNNRVMFGTVALPQKTKLIWRECKKVALKIILKEQYISHENSLALLDLETLKERREYLCLNFARKCLKNKKMKDLFPPNDSKDIMQQREPEHFKVLFARTNRFRESPIINMQNLLNHDIKRRMEQDKLWNI